MLSCERSEPNEQDRGGKRGREGRIPGSWVQAVVPRGVSASLSSLPGGVDLSHSWGGASHKEERGAEDYGDGHDGGSHSGDGLQRENEPFHEDSSKQHPQGRSRKVYST